MCLIKEKKEERMIIKKINKKKGTETVTGKRVPLNRWKIHDKIKPLTLRWQSSLVIAEWILWFSLGIKQYHRSHICKKSILMKINKTTGGLTKSNIQKESVSFKEIHYYSDYYYGCLCKDLQQNNFTCQADEYIICSDY